MNTESIAREVVDLKNRIEEVEADPDADQHEVKGLRDRMRILQSRLAERPREEMRDPDTQADKIQFIPPA